MGGSELAVRHRVVLLVDDEPGIMTAMTLLLEMEGYRVLQASNGALALELLDRNRPDVVVTDLMMPGLDGAGLVQAIRQRAELRGIPVLMMSAGTTPAEEILAMVDVYLSKGTSADAMLETIETLCAHPSGTGTLSDAPRM